MRVSVALILVIAFSTSCSFIDVVTEEVVHGVVLEKNFDGLQPNCGHLLVKFDRPVVGNEYIANCMIDKRTFDKMKVGSKYNMVIKKRNGEVVETYFVAEP